MIRNRDSMEQMKKPRVKIGRPVMVVKELECELPARTTVIAELIDETS